MRIVKIGGILIVLVLVAVAVEVSPNNSLAASAGSITGVCYDPVQQIFGVSVNALGDENDSGGYDEIGAEASTPFGDYHITFGTIPADGAYHAKTFYFDVSGWNLSTIISYCAGNGSGAGTPTSPGFSGCGIASVNTLPSCVYEGVPVPEGFEQRAITCDVAVYESPAGNVVAGATVYAGQHWYVNPQPVDGADGRQWTEIFVAGEHTGYIPTACVAP